MRKPRPWTVVGFVAAGALLVAAVAPQPGYEYRVVRYAGIDISQEAKKQDEQAAQLQQQLNGYAAEGWELAFVQGGFGILRR